MTLHEVSSDTENASLSLKECERPTWREGHPPHQGYTHTYAHTHVHTHTTVHTQGASVARQEEGGSLKDEGVVEGSVDGTM